jgi:hypothetical protein
MSLTQFRTFILTTLTLVTLSVASPAVSQAQDTEEKSPLKKASTELARGIAKYLSAKGEDRVLYGDFTGLKESTRDQVRTSVVDELKKQGIAEAKERGMEIRCQLAAEREGSKMLVLIEADILDRRGKVVHRYREIVECKPGDLAAAP